MASTAKSAQGSTLYIGELDADSPDAATVSGITKAVNPVVTATAHGLPEGSIVLFASVGGMTQINGKYACVGVIDANSFYAYGIDSTEYSTYTSSGTATTKRNTPRRVSAVGEGSLAYTSRAVNSVTAHAPVSVATATSMDAGVPAAFARTKARSLA